MATLETMTADPFAEFADAPTPAQDPYAEFEDAQDPFEEFSDADDLDIRPAEELVADRELFDPIQYFSDNPDVARDPKKLEKLLSVYRERDKEGLKASEVVKAAATEGPSAVGKIFTGTRDLAAGALNMTMQPFFNLAGYALSGDLFRERDRPHALAQIKKGFKGAAAEQAAGSELAAAGVADLARTGARKVDEMMAQSALSELGEGPMPDKTDQQLLLQLSEGVEFRKLMQTIAQGEGEVAKAIGFDKETLAKEGIEIRPEVVERLSLVDPLQIVAGAGVFRVVNAAGNVLLTAPTRAAAEAALGRIAAKTVTALPKATGKLIEGTGKLIGGTSKRVSSFQAGLGAGLMTGEPTTAVIAATSRMAAPPVGRAISATGRGISSASDMLAGSSTFQKALLGATEGAVSAAPIAAAAEDDKTAGAILGAGALLGGAARGAVEGAGAPSRALVESRLAPKEGVFPKTTSKALGIDKALDDAHSRGIATMPEQARNEINTLRESTRNLGGEIYALEPDVYFQTLLEHAERAKGSALSASDITQVENLARTRGYFDMTLPGAEGQTRRVVVLNSMNPDGPHEAGHLFFSLLAPERQADLIQTARDTLTPEQRAEYQSRYERDLGRTESEAYALEELVAENFSQVFQNTRLRDLQATPTLRQRIGNTLLNFAEEAGIDLTGGTTTPGGAPSSFRFNDAVRRAANEVLNPSPVEPTVTPRVEPITLSEAARQIEPLPRDIPAEVVSRTPQAPTRARRTRAAEITAEAETPAVEAAVTPEEAVAQADNAAEAATLAAEAPTEPLSGGTRSPRELLGQVSEAIAAQEGIKINYLSAPDEPAAATTSNRTTRREIIEAFRTMPAEARALWEKTFFPEKVAKTGKGYQVQGWAPEVFASNAHKAAKFLSETPDAQALSPYAVDPKTKSFTPEAWQQLYEDTQTFVQNQTRGATGSGEPLVVPRAVTEAGGFAPPTRPGARALDQTRADFINMLFGYKLPETPRIQKGRRPLNVVGQEVSEATMAGRVETPVRPRGEFAGPEAVRQGIEGVAISEVNPLRNQFEAAALAAKKPMPSFIEARQNLNLENIKEIQSAPEQPQFRGNTLTLTAGFQPERSWRVSGRRRGEKVTVNVTADDIASARKLAEAEGVTVDRVEAGDKLAMDVGFQPEQRTGDFRVLEEAERAFPRAKEIVDGRTVRKFVPNTDSIAAGFNEGTYEVLPGVREVPLSAFVLDDLAAPITESRALALAEQIKESKELNPLIVGLDEKGPYIIEGGHRYDALKHLKAKSLPALVVVEAGAKLAPMEAQFQSGGARTARGAEAEAAGFEVRHTGTPESPKVGLFKDSQLAGEILAVRDSPTDAYIREIRVAEPFRGQKLSEVLYREMGRRLQEEGIENVTGMVINERALSTRKKVFPDTTIESEVEAPYTPTVYEVRSRIPLELQFQGPIRSAALRDTKTGKIYEDVTHFGALNKLIPDLEKGFDLETGLAGRIIDGFVTREGDFVSREAAAELIGKEGELASEDLR